MHPIIPEMFQTARKPITLRGHVQQAVNLQPRYCWGMLKIKLSKPKIAIMERCIHKVCLYHCGLRPQCMYGNGASQVARYTHPHARFWRQSILIVQIRENPANPFIYRINVPNGSDHLYSAPVFLSSGAPYRACFPRYERFYTSTVDVRDCFYRMRIPPGVCSIFCFASHWCFIHCFRQRQMWQ